MSRIRKRLVATVCIMAAISSLGNTVGFGQQQAQVKNGKLQGAVYNFATGDPLTKATIKIIGNGHATVSGVNGEYSLVTPPGTHTLLFSREGFIEQTIESVTVSAGETKELNAVLTPVGHGESVTITANSSNDVAAMIEERKSATTVSDTISAVEIKKDTASSAAGVLQRVPGVSLVDRFVFVRGLGERYSNTWLNDALLPTTEPDRKVVPMDLIPSNLLQSVKILKTFTPDQPGEFSGGLVRLETVELPKAASLSVSFSLGFNSATYDQGFLGYSGGGARDFFGFGRGRRKLPAVIPASERLIRSNPFVPGESRTRSLRHSRFVGSAAGPRNCSEAISRRASKRRRISDEVVAHKQKRILRACLAGVAFESFAECHLRLGMEPGDA